VHNQIHDGRKTMRLSDMEFESNGEVFVFGNFECGAMLQLPPVIHEGGKMAILYAQML